MKHFPIIVADDFYNNVDEVRTFALSLDYSEVSGNFPGKRTKSLHFINEEFNKSSCAKFSSLFFDLDICGEFNCSISSQFQLFDSIGDVTNPYNKGWIHLDPSVIAAGVVYLTPEPNPNSGTSFYTLTGEYNNWNIDIQERLDFNESQIVSDSYLNKLIHNNNQFKETVSVKNVYNRVVGYDANTWHGATSHYSDNQRLTQVFFIYNIHCNSLSSLDRIKKIPSVL